MPFEFEDRLNWDLLGREYRQGRYPYYTAKDFYPIPAFVFECNSRIVMVGCKSQSAESHWKLGCWAQQRLKLSPSSQSRFSSIVQCKERHFCRLNFLTKIEFPEYNSYPYLLILEIPKWIPDILIEAWYYSGPELPREIEAINESLARIEARLPQ